MKSDNGGGGCPVMFGELHSPVGDDDITTTGIIPLNGTTYMYNIYIHLYYSSFYYHSNNNYSLEPGSFNFVWAEKRAWYTLSAHAPNRAGIPAR